MAVRLFACLGNFARLTGATPAPKWQPAGPLPPRRGRWEWESLSLLAYPGQPAPAVPPASQPFLIPTGAGSMNFKRRSLRAAIATLLAGQPLFSGTVF